MKRKRFLGVSLSMACMTVMAQNLPTADLLDVQFYTDGTAVDASPMQNTVEYFGSGTEVTQNSYLGRNVATFNNTWSAGCTGYYKVYFEENQEFRNALADGHSLEILVKPNYKGALRNVASHPFSAMHGGGTGFLINSRSNGPVNSFTFLPNVSTNGGSTWRWATSGVVPVSGFYYHVIGVWNKEEAKAYVYVDGVLCNAVDAPGEFHFAVSTCNWFCIGGDASNGAGELAWEGDIAIARVYDKALDGEEVTALWNAVKDGENAANMAVYVNTVDEGRKYLESVVATQSVMDEYAEALSMLEKVAGEEDRATVNEQYEFVGSMRSRLETSAAAYARYNERVQTIITYLKEDDSFEGTARDYVESYLNDYHEPGEDYPNGSYSYIWSTHTMTDEEIAAEAEWLDGKLKLAIEQGYKPGSDITNLLTNASFAEGFSGWQGVTGTGTGKSPTTNYYGAETYANRFDMYQTLNGLKDGIYVLTATAAYRPFGERYSMYYHANMYANENRLFLPTAYETRISVANAVDGVNCYITQNGDDGATDLELSEDGSGEITAYAMHGKTSVANAANGGRAINYLLANVTDGTLTVGFCNPNPNCTYDWVGIANIHLIYAGSMENAERYLDETLSCMKARAESILAFEPDLGTDYARYPNCPQVIKDKLQEAVNAVATATTPAEKYALMSTFTTLWDEFIEGRAAYVQMLRETDDCYNTATALKNSGDMSEEEYAKVEDAVREIGDAYANGSYTTEQAIAMEPLKALNMKVSVDENGVYLIDSNYAMAYFSRKANSATVPVRGRLVADIDHFTENQMIEEFCGELDGDFHTITVNIHRNGRGACLINNMRNGACVKNLTVKGEVHNSDKFATAVVANTYGLTSISGITSLIHVYSTTPGDAAHAGIMSCNRGTTTVRDCVFAGVMEGAGAINNSGIVGWTAGVTMIENCLQIGDIQLDASGSYTLAREPLHINIYNTYYKTPYGVVQGDQITDEQLASGEVCYMLNRGNTDNPTWYQTLGEDPYPVPNPSHQIVGKKSDGTFTNNASEFYTEPVTPGDSLPKADLLDVVFHEDGTAEDVSPMHSEVELHGAPVTYYNETYKRYAASFSHGWNVDSPDYYKVDFEANNPLAYALADGHSLEVLCMPKYSGTIPNAEAKPFSAHQGGGTGIMISAISGARQNELTFLPNITTSGSSTWQWVTSGVVPQSETFYHVVGVWNKEEAKCYIYVNGELKNIVDTPGLFLRASSKSNWFCVGGDAAPSIAGNSWFGDVAIARAYDKPLNQEDVTYLWNKVQNPDDVMYIFEKPMPASRGIYNLNGVHLEKPQKGINIIDGKKTLVK